MALSVTIKYKIVG